MRARAVSHFAGECGERVYTVAQAAKRYGYHPVAVRKAASDGRLKVWAREGRAVYFLESECARVLTRGHS